MQPQDVVFAATLFGAVLLVTPLLGTYMAAVLEGERTFLSPVLGPVERGIYRFMRIDPTVEQRWTGYAVSVLLFMFVSVLALYVQQRLQQVLPLNQAGLGPVSPPDLA